MSSFFSYRLLLKMYVRLHFKGIWWVFPTNYHFHHSKAFLLSNWRHFSEHSWLWPVQDFPFHLTKWLHFLNNKKRCNNPLYSFLACNTQHKIYHHELELASCALQILQITFYLYYLTMFTTSWGSYFYYQNCIDVEI